MRSDALLLRAVPFGDADLMVTLLTDARGLVSAVARSARRSLHRFPALEPMHLLRVAFEERPGADVASLVESSIARSRLGLVGTLERVEAAGVALRWVRRAVSPNGPEPELWTMINEVLDAIERSEAGTEAALAAGGGLRMLRAVGWGLELERCVRCDKPCAPPASALVDASQGGLVCRACGGGPVLLRADRRGRLVAATEGDVAALLAGDARVVSELVEAVLAAHAAR